MKLYKITYDLVDEDAAADGGNIVKTMQEFATSDGAASKRCTAIKAAFKKQLDGKVERAPIDVPSTKAELVEWLNKNATMAGAEVVK